MLQQKMGYTVILDRITQKSKKVTTLKKLSSTFIPDFLHYF